MMNFEKWQNLAAVTKPVRYIGEEFNQIKKSEQEIKVSFALAFPDVYEIGMSHLGYKILYQLINEQKGYAAERVFTPWPDRESQLREKGELLATLESKRPLKDFDIVGFSLQYELSYTNILTMLDLAQIPLRTEQRAGFPLIIGGGVGSFNPEPLSYFFDCFLVGEGEEAVLELLEIIAQSKDNTWSKQYTLQQLSKKDGFYVPGLYDYQRINGFYIPVEQKNSQPSPIKKRLIKNLNHAYFPTKVVVPYTETVHDRVSLEIARGCTRGCRFCQAGMIYRPVRERGLSELKQQAQKLLKSTGYDEVSLLSLSSTDYSLISELVNYLSCQYADLAIGLALPSLRVDAFSIGLANQIQAVRKSSLTFAPEAGTERMRRIINKNILEEDLLSAAEAAFKSGWINLKLYFMIGLPGENIEDVEGICSLAKKVNAVGRKYAQRRPQITVNISIFVPKPHTPFQWAPFIDEKQLQQKVRILRDNLKGRSYKLQIHDYQQSYLEALFARGDKEMGNLLQKAWLKGCRFDSWREHFNFPLWQQVLADSKLKWAEDVFNPLDLQSDLPWDHISTGVNKSFLLLEHKKAQKEILTADCRQGRCRGCGCCEKLECGVQIMGGTFDAHQN